MLKKQMVALIAVIAVGVLALAHDADARRGRGNDDPPRPPECQVEDGGVLVCK